MLITLQTVCVSILTSFWLKFQRHKFIIFDCVARKRRPMDEKES